MLIKALLDFGKYAAAISPPYRSILAGSAYMGGTWGGKKK